MSVHSESAQTRIEEVRAMRQKLPNFVIPTFKGERKLLTKAASVPAAFVELFAVGIKNNPLLARSGGLDPDQIRDLKDYAEAYAPVADELEALAAFVRHSVTVARHKVGSEALATYVVAGRLSKLPQHADLAPHVADMKRALRVKRKAKVEEEPTPAPTTPPPVATL
jgi:hypothetical protein